MDWLILLIIIIIVVILCKLFWNPGHFIGWVMGGAENGADDIVGGARPKSGKKSILRVKDLQKHPRSRSEAEAIQHLEQLTGKKFPTVNPSWLKWKGQALELDGYNEALGLAIEFSGPQHTKWVPSKELYTDYFERIVRDVVKKRVCKKHKVKLIVLDVSLPSKYWRAYIASRLHDLGIAGQVRPADYIPEQVVIPYRNPQIEQELGLTVDMSRAQKI